MFSKIDNFLIKWTQWIVRQVELYTEITRKDIFAFFIKLEKVAFVLYAAACIIFVLINPINHFISLIAVPIMYYITSYNQNVIKTIIETENTENILPKEILTREKIRIFLILFCLFFIFFGINLKYDYFVVMFAMLLNLIVAPIIPICIEYLLCTTSLPPGEKERKKIEKEMSSLVPIRIRN